jgi:hypothetical protein
MNDPVTITLEGATRPAAFTDIWASDCGGSRPAEFPPGVGIRISGKRGAGHHG